MSAKINLIKDKSEAIVDVLSLIEPQDYFDPSGYFSFINNQIDKVNKINTTLFRSKRYSPTAENLLFTEKSIFTEIIGLVSSLEYSSNYDALDRKAELIDLISMYESSNLENVVFLKPCVDNFIRFMQVLNDSIIGTVSYHEQLSWATFGKKPGTKGHFIRMAILNNHSREKLEADFLEHYETPMISGNYLWYKAKLLNEYIPKSATIYEIRNEDQVAYDSIDWEGEELEDWNNSIKSASATLYALQVKAEEAETDEYRDAWELYYKHLQKLACIKWGLNFVKGT